MNKIIGVIICIVCLSTACSKIERYEGAFIVKTTLNAIKDSTITNNPNIVGYAFYSDTLQARPNSYDEAQQGIITSNDGAEIGHSIQGSFLSEEKEMFQFQPLEENPIVVVVCDTLNKIYAYRNVTIDRSVEKIYVSLQFDLWRLTAETPSYTTGRWIVKRDYVTVE